MTRLVVYHDGYGCDTGCCGHTVELSDGDVLVEAEFVFDHADHPGEDVLEFARRVVTETFGAEHVADLDWDPCTIVTDCDW